ncbi:response regulator transcription factor [Arthrobacter sp.]|uniref:response regulator transcription factor n=1 Tax=Arthrobacter sp. TaxID=1667 RepID=UPI003A9414CA
MTVQERRVAVVVEDDEDIRGLLEAVLLQSGFEVHQTGSGVAAVELVAQQDPELVTLDLGLPDIDGFEVARRIRRDSDAHIVMLTARTDEIDTVLGLETGADDFLTKPFSPRELRARIEAIMRRRARDRAAFQTAAAHPAAEAASPGFHAAAAGNASGPGPDRNHDAGGSLRLNGLVLDAPTYSVTVDGRDTAVTPTEFTLLHAILAGGRTVRTKTSLVRRLRDEEADSGTFVSDADERSIEVHVGNLRRKLGDDAKAPRWIETVRGVGYRAAPERAAPQPARSGTGLPPAVGAPATRQEPAADDAGPAGLSMRTCPDHLEVSFSEGTRLDEHHLKAISNGLVECGSRSLVVVCTGLSSMGTSVAAWDLHGRNIRAAFVGAGPTDRLLVHLFNRSDAESYTWEYFEDLDQARSWSVGPR